MESERDLFSSSPNPTLTLTTPPTNNPPPTSIHTAYTHLAPCHPGGSLRSARTRSSCSGSKVSAGRGVDLCQLCRTLRSAVIPPCRDPTSSSSHTNPRTPRRGARKRPKDCRDIQQGMPLRRRVPRRVRPPTRPRAAAGHRAKDGRGARQAAARALQGDRRAVPRVTS